MGGTGIGNALVTDLIPRQSLGEGLAIFGSANWIGGMIGFAAAGALLQSLGSGPTFVIGGGLPLLAAGFVVLVQAGHYLRRLTGPVLPPLPYRHRPR